MGLYWLKNIYTIGYISYRKYLFLQPNECNLSNKTDIPPRHNIFRRPGSVSDYPCVSLCITPEAVGETKAWKLYRAAVPRFSESLWWWRRESRFACHSIKWVKSHQLQQTPVQRGWGSVPGHSDTRGEGPVNCKHGCVEITGKPDASRGPHKRLQKLHRRIALPFPPPSLHKQLKMMLLWAPDLHPQARYAEVKDTKTGIHFCSKFLLYMQIFTENTLCFALSKVMLIPAVHRKMDMSREI